MKRKVKDILFGMFLLCICLSVQITGKASTAKSAGCNGNITYEVLDQAAKLIAITKMNYNGTVLTISGKVDGYTVVQIGKYMTFDEIQNDDANQIHIVHMRELVKIFSNPEKVKKVVIPKK